MPRRAGFGFLKYEGREIPEDRRTYSPDRRLFSACYVARDRTDLYDDDTDYEVPVWHTETEVEMTSFACSHNRNAAGEDGSPPTGLRFTDDLRHLVVGFADGSECMHPIPPHPGMDDLLWQYLRALREWTTPAENDRLDAVDAAWTRREGGGTDATAGSLMADRTARVLAPMALDRVGLGAAARELPPIRNARTAHKVLARMEALSVDHVRYPLEHAALAAARAAVKEVSGDWIFGYRLAQASADAAQAAVGISRFAPALPAPSAEWRANVMDHVSTLLEDLAALLRAGG